MLLRSIDPLSIKTRPSTKRPPLQGSNILTSQSFRAKPGKYLQSSLSRSHHYPESAFIVRFVNNVQFTINTPSIRLLWIQDIIRIYLPIVDFAGLGSENIPWTPQEGASISSTRLRAGQYRSNDVKGARANSCFTLRTLTIGLQSNDSHTNGFGSIQPSSSAVYKHHLAPTAISLFTTRYYFSGSSRTGLDAFVSTSDFSRHDYFHIVPSSSPPMPGMRTGSRQDAPFWEPKKKALNTIQSSQGVGVNPAATQADMHVPRAALQPMMAAGVPTPAVTVPKVKPAAA